MQFRGNGDYQQRRSCADTFVGQQLEILGRLLGIDPAELRLPTAAEDYAGVDVFAPNGLRIGLRIRDISALAKHDFALRITRDNRGCCEIDKIRNGTPDLLLYCYASGDKIIAYRLLDLSVFRCAASCWFDGVEHQLHSGDGYGFISFDLSGFEAYGRIVLSSEGC
jgi:hypothetical protein